MGGMPKFPLQLGALDTVVEEGSEGRRAGSGARVGSYRHFLFPL